MYECRVKLFRGGKIMQELGCNGKTFEELPPD